MPAIRILLGVARTAKASGKAAHSQAPCQRPQQDNRLLVEVSLTQLRSFEAAQHQLQQGIWWTCQPHMC